MADSNFDKSKKRSTSFRDAGDVSSFEKFKKRYPNFKAMEGDGLLSNPPPIPLAGNAVGVLRATAPTLIQRGKEVVEAVAKAAKEPTKKTPRQRNAEQGGPRPLNKGAKRLEGKLEKMRQEGNRLRAENAKGKKKAPSRGADAGTTAGRVRDAAKRERTPREKEQFGPLVPRRDNLPAKQPGRNVAVQNGGQRAVAVREAGRRDMVPYKAQGRSVTARTFGDKGQGARVAPSGTGRAVNAPSADDRKRKSIGYMPAMLDAGKAKADSNRKSGGMSFTPAVNNQKAGEGKSDKEKKAQAFREKQQGMKTRGVKKDVPRKVTDTSKVSGKRNEVKKLSNFERMKARGYEKEGIAGRSATSKGIKDRVVAERKYKFSDLLKK